MMSTWFWRSNLGMGAFLGTETGVGLVSYIGARVGPGQEEFVTCMDILIETFHTYHHINTSRH